MLPIFPNFKRLEITDKSFFDNFTKDYLPYSDFNFTSLYSYDYGTNEISLLNDNLVIQLPDYITNEPLYSFLGSNKPIETVDTLFDFIKTKNIKPQIRLLPEESIKQDVLGLLEKYNVERDRDGYDYVLSTEMMSNLDGPEFRMHRNMVRNFVKEVPDFQSVDLDITNPDTQKEILDLTHLWGVKKEKEESEIQHEIKATTNLFNLANSVEFVTIGIYSGDKLLSFFIAELLPNKYAIGHFRKADSNFSGIFRFIDHQMAGKLYEKGREFFNFEQDMGIETLRKAKMSWNPVGFIKKYIITSR